jgi:prevent-host-death family protein
MTVVTIHQAKTNLSKLIAEVENGGEVVIARGDKPVVRLAPIEPARKLRSSGMWKGRVTLDERFFEPLPDDELSLWNGEGR